MSSSAPEDKTRTAPRETEEPYPPPRISWYVVAILVLIFVFSFLDRQIINLLVGPIKKDFNIDDTMMGILMGPTFAIFYSFFGMPIGRLADRGTRVWIIAVGLFFWSFATAGCGLVRTYWHLFAMRVGVGVGEATLAPAAYSMMADLFPRERLPFAMSVYGTGISIGAGLAVIIGGLLLGFLEDRESIDIFLLGPVRPWQSVFIFIGLLGFIPLAVLLLTVREPRRRDVVAGEGSIPLGEVFDYLRANARTFVPHHLGMGILAVASYGVGSWVIEFFMRKHGWTPSQVGLGIGGNTAITGTLGALAGGVFASRLHRKGHRDANMRTALFASLVPLPFALSYPLISDGRIAYLFLIPSTFFVFFPIGAAGASIQEMVPAKMRGQVSAIYIFVVNMVGMGLGPPLVGALTEHVFRDEAKLGYSFVATSATMHVIGAFLIWRSLRHYTETLDNAQSWRRKA